MISKPRTVRQTDAFHDACKKRAKHLKYRSFSAYMNGLARYDLMIQKPHLVTGPISKAAPDVQEAIERGILSGKASDNSKISYLEHLVADTTSVIARRIVEDLPMIIRQSLAGGVIDESTIRRKIIQSATKRRRKKGNK